MNYNDYEKLSDKVMDLGYNTVLKMNVVLAKKNQDGRRNHFYKEYSYKTNKYVNANKLYNISRNFDYYLSIERYNDTKEFLMIRDENMLNLRFGIDLILPWFGSSATNVFAYQKDNNKIIILQGSWTTVEVEISMNKKLYFQPTVIHNTDNTYTPGVRILLDSEYSFIDMTINRFMGFVYNIKSMYLFQLAQNMLNFFGRPDLGTNLTTYSYASEIENVVEDVSGGADSIKGGSDVVLRKKKGVFDQIDSL